ncbi:MAG: hypothetical protein R3E97_04225 [Candidatus Eisenbacteria bacterium]
MSDWRIEEDARGRRWATAEANHTVWSGAMLVAALALLVALTLSACYTQVLPEPPRDYPEDAYVSGRGAEADGVPYEDYDTDVDPLPPSRGTLPSEGTLVLLVREQPYRLDGWALLAESPWIGGGPDLECEVRGVGTDVEHVAFRYPGANAWVFQATVSQGGERIEFPSRWRSADALPFTDHRADPEGFRLFRREGYGEWVWFEESAYDFGPPDPYRVWDAVSDRELVAGWVENGGWVGMYRLPRLSMFPPGGTRWVVFVRP